MQLLYLLIDFSAVFIPIIFSFHPKISFHKEFPYVFPAIILSAIPFIIWDIYFTSLGIWGFNKRYITGYYIFNLPIEEALFFICIPYACLFTYHSVKIFLSSSKRINSTKLFPILFSVVLLIISINDRDKSYTLYSFISTAFLISLIVFMVRPSWLYTFWITYIFLIIPFLIVNGILTGTGPDEPVVWYNNLENMGLRIQTIPIEDFTYGLELILLNVFFYETIKIRSTN